MTFAKLKKKNPCLFLDFLVFPDLRPPCISCLKIPTNLRISYPLNHLFNQSERVLKLYYYTVSIFLLYIGRWTAQYHVRKYIQREYLKTKSFRFQRRVFISSFACGFWEAFSAATPLPVPILKVFLFHNLLSQEYCTGWKWKNLGWRKCVQAMI